MLPVTYDFDVITDAPAPKRRAPERRGTKRRRRTRRRNDDRLRRRSRMSAARCGRRVTPTGYA